MNGFTPLQGQTTPFSETNDYVVVGPEVYKIMQQLTRSRPMSTIGIMLDVETFGVGSDSVVAQVALLPFDLEDPEKFVDGYREYLPIDPQIAMGSMIESNTLKFWLLQDDRARARMAKYLEGDHATLVQYMNNIANIIVTYRDSMGYDELELWAKGPQFDVILLERLLRMTGIDTPWDYSKVRDLRTLMAEAGVHSSDVDEPKDFVKHSALSDCRLQVRLYFAAQKKLGER